MFLFWMLMIMMVVSSSSSTLPRWHYSGQRQSFRSIQSSPSFYRHLLHMTNTNNNNPLTNNTTTTTTTSTTLSSLRQSTLSQLLVPSSFALAALAYVSLGATIVLNANKDEKRYTYLHEQLFGTYLKPGATPNSPPFLSLVSHLPYLPSLPHLSARFLPS